MLLAIGFIAIGFLVVFVGYCMHFDETASTQVKLTNMGKAVRYQLK